jgi:hypothetical protein
MKLDRSEFDVIKSKQYDTLTCGIEDEGIIFDILCNKMYEQPLKTAIQEYMCNARDSHREAGIPDTPIKIILPTPYAPILKIIDYGVGISPDRIKNVFLYLGKSTKCENNIETGGYGVGSKIGWAYASVFTVITIYDNIKYTYLAYIGENNIGKLDLLDKENVNSGNSTTIELSILPEDVKSVEQYVYIASHFWKVRPIIVGASSDYDEIPDEYNYNSGDVKILNTSKISYSDRHKLYLMDGSSVNCVVDGILYKNIDKNIPELDILFDMTSWDSMFIFFDVGEVDIAVNREGLQYTKKTISAITEKLRKAYDKTTSEVDDLIKGKSLNEIINNLDIVKPKFRHLNCKKFEIDNIGFELVKTLTRDVNVIYNFQKDAIVFKSDLDVGDILRNHGNANTINIKSNRTIIFNDKFTKTINRPRLKKWMNENGITEVCIIIPSAEYKTNQDGFYKKHKKFLKNIKTNLITDVYLQKEIILDKNIIHCYLYNTINRYRTDRKKTLVEYNDDLKNNNTLLYSDIISPLKLKNYLMFIRYYNNVYQTNYSLITFNKRDVKKVHKMDEWVDFMEWYTEKVDEIFYNPPIHSILTNLSYFFNSRAHKVDYRIISGINSIHDPIIKIYVNSIKISPFLEKKINSDDGGIMSLFNLACLHKKEKPIIQKRIDSIIERKQRRDSRLKTYLRKHYPLIAYKVDRYVNEKDIVNYINDIDRILYKKNRLKKSKKINRKVLFRKYN